MHLDAEGGGRESASPRDSGGQEAGRGARSGVWILSSRQQVTNEGLEQRSDRIRNTLERSLLHRTEEADFSARVRGRSYSVHVPLLWSLDLGWAAD